MASSRSQLGALGARCGAMNSSVTTCRAISVTSSLCLAIRLSSRSNGPSKPVDAAPRTPTARLARDRLAGPPATARRPARSPSPAHAEGQLLGLGLAGRPRLCRWPPGPPGRGPRGPAAGRPRAAGLVGAYAVIGSPATVASGNFTVRLMTVWNTWSPNASTTPGQHLAAVQRAASYMVGQDAVDLQVGVEPVLDLLDRVHEQGDAAQGEELALQRDDHAVRGGQRVDGEQAERGLAVDEDRRRSRRRTGRSTRARVCSRADLADQLDLGRRTGRCWPAAGPCPATPVVPDDVARPWPRAVHQQVVDREVERRAG